jgi:hypothetical protein
LQVERWRGQQPQIAHLLNIQQLNQPRLLCIRVNQPACSRLGQLQGNEQASRFNAYNPDLIAA